MTYRRYFKEALQVIKKLKYNKMTGYINRDYFESILMDYVTQQLVENGGTLIFFDLDKLKWYNSKFGYQAGDSYIQRVTAKVLNEVKYDLENIYGKRGPLYAIRQGGDEFLIIVPKYFIYAPYSSKEFTFSKTLLMPFDIKDKKGLIEVIKRLGQEVLNQKKYKKR